MTPKLWNVALIAGGLLLVCAGLQQWRSNDQPRLVVTDFLEAVKTNDRLTALQLMTPELRSHVQEAGDEFDAAWADPPPGESHGADLEYEIESLRVQGDIALAETLFRHAGMPFVNSEIELQRSGTGLWKIARIDNRVNLAWQMLENQQLAIELRNAVKDLPGAQIAEEPAPSRRWQ